MNKENCLNCTKKCPQEELACEIAKGRMYATEEVIRLQKEVEKQRWIPCSERLPEEADGDSDVWFPTLYVTTKFGKLRTGFYRTDSKEWYLYDEYDEEWIMANNNDVVAWMPLPEPYKGE